MSASARGEAAARIGDLDRVFARSVSREDFRNLPFFKILIPTLGEPRLHFSGAAAAWASGWDTELDELRESYTEAEKFLARAHDPAALQSARRRLIGITQKVHRLHLRRVALADGFSWPELPYCWFLFEGDPDPYE
jgi:hypothetical protein